MLQDFKAFILRGNVVDLAIGVAIGAAFTAVVSSFTANLLTPLLAIPGNAARFSEFDFTIAGAQFRYGAFIDAIVTFVITASVLFFLVVKPVNALMARRKTEMNVEAETRDCPECLSSVPAAARRCAYCTTVLSPTTT